ncbi:transglycosylase SLT domain-containing protein [Nocardia sp. IBHARD005]|uniref:transglycosylase SLT domain-containing protein n=1 Tax=Nocardia sp. IBHARD005 TaxID=3457765 RepID=UPI0040587788
MANPRTRMLAERGLTPPAGATATGDAPAHTSMPGRAATRSPADTDQATPASPRAQSATGPIQAAVATIAAGQQLGGLATTLANNPDRLAPAMAAAPRALESAQAAIGAVLKPGTPPDLSAVAVAATAAVGAAVGDITRAALPDIALPGMAVLAPMTAAPRFEPTPLVDMSDPGSRRDVHIEQALDARGVTDPQSRANWAAGYRTLIERESGNNPCAINNWDSNAAAGHPSQGYTQTIPATFRNHHQPGTSDEITDPVANIAASMNYVQARYGVDEGASNLQSRVQQANSSLPPKGY